MNLHGPYLRNSSTNPILIDHILQLCNGGLFFTFPENKKKAKTLKKCEISYIDLIYSRVCIAHLSVMIQRI